MKGIKAKFGSIRSIYNPLYDHYLSLFLLKRQLVAQVIIRLNIEIMGLNMYSSCLAYDVTLALTPVLPKHAKKFKKQSKTTFLEAISEERPRDAVSTT